MRYYIADCHFFHESLNYQMDCRGFANAEEMNNYMIEQWNKKVRWNDEVVILGDFSLGKADCAAAAGLLRLICCTAMSTTPGMKSSWIRPARLPPGRCGAAGTAKSTIFPAR